jgi:hypothetical protein
MIVKTYQRKPVAIQALLFEYTSNAFIEMHAFCGSDLVSISKDRHPSAKAKAVIEGPAGFIAFEGDYILKDADGNLSLCKPDVFAATYEEVIV